MTSGESLGARIAERRKSLRLSIRAVSRKSGIAPSTICNWEAGLSTPEGHYLKALCRALEISAEQLQGAVGSLVEGASMGHRLLTTWIEKRIEDDEL